ncbi:MAG TPA: nicotinamide-nucleotide amidohydrolase family protein, partial [Allocoleopsis sp.]
KAPSEAAALKQIEPVEQQLRAIGGLDCYGTDEESLASVVGNLLQARGHTVAVAESCTGGGLGHLITSVAGSSTYFRGGVISYDNQVKIDVLGVNAADLNQYGAVSEQVAQQMAIGVRQQLRTTWGLSITGIAGPDGGTEAKPVGLVYLGIAGPDEQAQSFRFQYGDFRGREAIRWLSACTALDLLRRQLLSISA